MEDTHYCWSQCCDLGPHACICGNGCEMGDARIKAEQLAAEKYRIIAIDGVPSGHAVRNAFIDGYLTARTITAGELEAAAEDLAWRLNEWEDGQIVWESPEDVAEEIAECKPLARAAFRAAGLLIEGEEAHHDL